MHSFYLGNICFQCPFFFQEKGISPIRLGLSLTWAIFSFRMSWCLTTSNSFQESSFNKLSLLFLSFFSGCPLQLPIVMSIELVKFLSIHFLLSPAPLSHTEDTFSSVLLLVSSTKCLPTAKAICALAWLPAGRTDPDHCDGSYDSSPSVRVTHLAWQKLQDGSSPVYVPYVPPAALCIIIWQTLCCPLCHPVALSFRFWTRDVE